MSKRWWEWDPVFRIDPERTALVIIDMQNGFVEPGAVLEVPMARQQVPAITRLLDFCRSRSIPAVFTAFCVGPDFNYPFYWQMARQRGLHVDPPARTFWEDKHETKIVQELRLRPEEIVIKKYGYDAFANTQLEDVLRSLNVSCLMVAGTVVNWCVDSTIRSAFHRGYQLVIVADGVSGYDHAGISADTWRDVELDLFAEAFGRVMSVEDIIKELSDT